MSKTPAPKTGSFSIDRPHDRTQQRSGILAARRNTGHGNIRSPVPEFSYTVTEHDAERPWIVLGTSRGKVALPDDATSSTGLMRTGRRQRRPGGASSSPPGSYPVADCRSARILGPVFLCPPYKVRRAATVALSKQHRDAGTEQAAPPIRRQETSAGYRIGRMWLMPGRRPPIATDRGQN